jgi:hypothetical protein
MTLSDYIIDVLFAVFWDVHGRKAVSNDDFDLWCESTAGKTDLARAGISITKYSHGDRIIHIDECKMAVYFGEKKNRWAPSWFAIYERLMRAAEAGQ